VVEVVVVVVAAAGVAAVRSFSGISVSANIVRVNGLLRTGASGFFHEAFFFCLIALIKQEYSFATVAQAGSRLNTAT
jgi:hypothetical protein